MRTELKRLHSDTNSTFVYVTHDQLEAMTLSTRVCLMNAGVLQQYAPPLTVYNEPANQFVAEFVGNPTMNFVPATVTGSDGSHATLDFLGSHAIFHANKGLSLSGNDVIVGIRPEFLPITDSGKISGIAYSTLPSGMETTVKISVDSLMLTSVVFGSVDYPVDLPLKMDVTGNSVILFDKITQKQVGIGSLEIQ
jgi:multiple sugar transport system ATP-binding protein